LHCTTNWRKPQTTNKGAFNYTTNKGELHCTTNWRKPQTTNKGALNYTTNKGELHCTTNWRESHNFSATPLLSSKQTKCQREKAITFRLRPYCHQNKQNAKERKP